MGYKSPVPIGFLPNRLPPSSCSQRSRRRRPRSFPFSSRSSSLPRPPRSAGSRPPARRLLRLREALPRRPRCSGSRVAAHPVNSAWVASLLLLPIGTGQEDERE
ncbi:hypothetical protein VPH35_055772 [Triticum aestivum]